MPKNKQVGKEIGLAKQGPLAGSQEKKDLWKRGQVSHEDSKDVVKLCRENIRRAKAQLELNLAIAVKDNKMFL